jgi:hypothetical protein
MNIPCTWHRVTDRYHQLRTPRGIVLAVVVCSDGTWIPRCTQGDPPTWGEFDRGVASHHIEVAKKEAEQMAARSVT